MEAEKRSLHRACQSTTERERDRATSPSFKLRELHGYSATVQPYHSSAAELWGHDLMGSRWHALDRARQLSVLKLPELVMAKLT